MNDCPQGGRHSYHYPRGSRGLWVCSKCDHRAILAQPGPQQKFLASRADIAIYGGSAGSGKSLALLMQPLRHINNGGFGAVIFRRTNPEIMKQGALWDQSHDLYYHLGGKPYYGQSKQWVFPSGARVSFSHMEHESDKESWNSSQVPLIQFDELVSFSESQFIYMLSRNRSLCGINPYLRAACNPDSDSWVAKWVDWWIGEDGYPIPERGGVLRWFLRDGNELVWFDHKDQALDWIVTNWKISKQKAAEFPKSFTFVPALLEDNKILEAVNPQYRANLMAMPLVERERLLRGNWRIRPAAGLKFPRTAWVTKYQEPPPGMRLVRFWDRAFTEGGKGARTAGVLMGDMGKDQAEAKGLPRFWVVHAETGRWGDAEREKRIRARAEMDRQQYGEDVTVGIEQEPGAGKHSARMTVMNLSGFNAFRQRPIGNKSARWTNLASQQQVGNVAICTNNTWNWAEFINELDALAGNEALDRGKLKDLADAASAAFLQLQHSPWISNGLVDGLMKEYGIAPEPTEQHSGGIDAIIADHTEDEEQEPPPRYNPLQDDDD